MLPESVAIETIRPSAFFTPFSRSRNSPRRTGTPFSASHAANTRSATCGSNVHIVCSAWTIAFVPCPPALKSSIRSQRQADGSW